MACGFRRPQPQGPGDRGVRIFVATENPGKIREIKALLSQSLPDAQAYCVADLQEEIRKQYVAEETGTTYAENALIKARALAVLLPAEPCSFVVAEDSGFEVDALGGVPGVYSARYAEKDNARCKKILKSMHDIFPEQRTAKFVACMALLDSLGNPTLFYGRKEGFVADTARGEHGFGYDPIFCTEPGGPTWGELGAAEKNKDSHRSRALHLVVGYLNKIANRV